MIIPSSQAVAELDALKVREIWRPRDAQIFCPTVQWLDHFARWILTQRWRARPETMDCDDFAVRAVDRATEALNEANLLQDCGHGICMTEITLPTWLKNGTPSPGYLGAPPGVGFTHMTNLVRCESGWRFFEPQTGKHEDAKTILDAGIVGTVLWVWV